MVLFPWFVAVPLAVGQFLMGHIGSIKFLLRTKTPNDMLQTPYYTAVFQASAFWLGVIWIHRIVLSKSSSLMLGIPSAKES